PVLGFQESFTSTTSGWDSFSGVVTNPGTGGLFGPGDGYLFIQTTSAFNWGARSLGLEYAGDWTAAGVTQVRVWLNDVGADDALEIHFGIGNAGNFWQYNVGFLPPLHQWAVFTVDLTSGANWTRIIGTT